MVLLPFVFCLSLLTGCFSPEDLLEKAKLQQDETETTTLVESEEDKHICVGFKFRPY